jgi:hypothetical protein
MLYSIVLTNDVAENQMYGQGTSENGNQEAESQPWQGRWSLR